MTVSYLVHQVPRRVIQGLTSIVPHRVPAVILIVIPLSLIGEQIVTRILRTLLLGVFKRNCQHLFLTAG